MGVDIYLKSVFDPFIKEYEKRPAPDAGRHLNAASIADGAIDWIYDDYRASGGYFRNGYNSGDVMWAMGLSWSDTVRPMLDAENRLPIERARELLAMIEARPLIRERLARHFHENMTGGIDQHPVTGRTTTALLQAAAAGGGGVAIGPEPPDFEALAAFVTKRREELLAILRKSIELNEPLMLEA